MTRQPRTLYHVRITYHRPNTDRSYILDESHSYDLVDIIDTMIQHTRNFPRDNGYTCDFDPNALKYTVTKFSEKFATMEVRSSDDGIDL
jgi:hypothetical protein